MTIALFVGGAFCNNFNLLRCLHIVLLGPQCALLSNGLLNYVHNINLYCMVGESFTFELGYRYNYMYYRKRNFENATNIDNLLVEAV